MRAAVVLIRGGQVALIRRRRAGSEYWLFPGGGVETGESPADAAAREAKEELGLDVRIDRMVATVIFRGNTQIFFAATEIGGCFGSGTGEELASDDGSVYGSYEPCWRAIAELEGSDVRPRAVARLVNSTEGWPPRPLEIVEAV
jgi:8-oxo-dGTP pyrophosphatase MutT (NUDIX family)